MMFMHFLNMENIIHTPSRKNLSMFIKKLEKWRGENTEKSIVYIIFIVV
jgi:predicted metal-dependent TIM-barrel fold hydrolase